MSDIGSLVERLVEAGLSIGEAGEIIATAFAAGAASSSFRKSPGAARQQRWRERNKTSQSVTPETPCRPENEASQIVSKRYEASQSNAASLSKEEKKDEVKKEKREARATQMPEGWRPSPESWAEASMMLGSEDRAEIELKKFRNHASEKGRTSKRWNSAWANWAIKAVEYGGRNGHGTSGNRTSPTAGSSSTGADAILAGMGRLASRVAERQLAERQHGLDLAGSDDADGGAAAYDAAAHRRAV